MIMKLTRILFSASFFLLTAVASFAQNASRARGEALVMVTPDAEVRLISQRLNNQLGAFADVRPVELLSAPMRTWLFAFNEDQIEMKDFLYAIKKDNQVLMAQTNKFISERLVPNDPFYGQQWHHNDPQDHDIDTPEAWEITTGGTTITGDDIVVCVIESNGAKWDQADIVENHWVNVHEIPNNGVDDDGNGYVDDYDGWSVTNNSDNLGTGNHGTQVSSMIGAKGNNGTGITGVNWDVKIMQVAMGGITESNVVSAYTYPWVLRKMYNESNGALGAFVVATNSSWGIDGGDPNDAPIWCAMYDSLGVHGIISCGATANNNVNIDVVGDLPTACPSEFMISVTATNDADLRTFSGYGTTHVDLGAPGEDVYLAGNNSYGNTSGTSFATPCVAGAIALLYSAPCVTFMGQVLNDPEAGAILIRDYIFNGTDAVSNLSDETMTGGRLNVKNSLDLLLANCFDAPCVTPFGISAAQNNGGLDYTVSWVQLEQQTAFNFRFRQVGAANWVETNNVTINTFILEDLIPCAEYEIQVQTICETENSPWSTTFILATDGCCIHPDGVAVNVTGLETATITWNSVLAATGYTVVITNLSGDVVSNTTANSTSIDITGLTSCTDYNVQVSSICNAVGLPPASTVAFSTPGCGSCTDFTYCEVGGDSELEWIAEVEINNASNVSDANSGGYAFFEDFDVELTIGGEYTITLTPGFSGNQTYPEYFRVWIDFNANGTFDASELVFNPEETTTTSISGDVIIPETAFPGSTRMRVAMSYGGFWGGAIPEACEDVTYGEFEDYCVNIVAPVSVQENESNSFVFFPNPAINELRWNDNNIKEIRIFDVSGRVLLTELNLNRALDVSAISNGVYQVVATKTDGSVLSNQMIIRR